ncbi:glycerophosphoryl diester phosphodiesterase [Labrys miyagiensis]|uniref:Glycerophosphoryl diester phosphodiesterase n=2 Tax=Labrys miyagiensis TaxID=346912 RepID=A0ABQ6CCC3_9HYPH|nr:glycerophosphoryl diester phosphodiesterase [Labrys miyagiensis]
MRRRLDDIPFTPAILAEALAAGASSEVDLRAHGEAGFVVQHDETLDRETTGSGPVATATEAQLRRLHRRGADGHPTSERLLLLNDLADLAGREAAPGALVQLDLKEDAAAISPTLARNFGRAIAPVAARFILSGHDWEAVGRLAQATKESGAKELALGFDPCGDKAMERLESYRDFEVFVAEALRRAPAASTIYLDYGIILKAAATGHDIVRAFHAAGKLIDAYTLNLSHPQAERSLRRLVDLKVDQITTDEPIALQACFEQGQRAAERILATRAE